MPAPGLSPLARGNLPSLFDQTCRHGPIPACAGQPRHARRCHPTTGAYPRLRGATIDTGLIELLRQGLSPLARGNHGTAIWLCWSKGPIPACAGQPGRRRWCQSAAGAYPRLRGATPLAPALIRCESGLSPLARGNLLTINRNYSPTRAYPRLRGATFSKALAVAWIAGLSPLARGNHMDGANGSTTFGPIPACAGQPSPHSHQAPSWRAYPRLRGATWVASCVPVCSGGLSPLARGNQASGRLSARFRGPIPACAGQPAAFTSAPCPPRAYPRLRGATPYRRHTKRVSLGLSPLARGNLGRVRKWRYRGGPIPACAGQPSACVGMTRTWWAYPRLRGATGSAGLRTSRMGGLSPLARGNRSCSHLALLFVRPIPACAGQPGSYHVSFWQMWAYPRLRGATAIPHPPTTCSMGLSPLEQPSGWFLKCLGPIPACAGQPWRRCGQTWPTGAYPRLRGATMPVFVAAIGGMGLSPLARGNPRRVPGKAAPVGPIPACAGQPVPGRNYACCQGAYPRLRGATH